MAKKSSTATKFGKPGTKHADQVGVECLEPNTLIWENDIRTRLQQAAFVEAAE